MDLKELLAKRANLINQARAVLDRSKAESRAMSADERAQWDKLLDEAQALKDTVDREEKLRQLEVDLEQSARVVPPVVPGATANSQRDLEKSALDKAKVLTERREPRTDLALAAVMSEAERKALRVLESRAMSQWLISGGGPGMGQLERAALQMDVDSQGGYLVAPQQFISQLIKAVDDQVFIRQWATKHTVEGAKSLGAASLDSDPADSDWTSEVGTGSEDSTMAFGKRELAPHPLAKLIKVSDALLRGTMGGAEALVLLRLAYKFAVSEEKAYMLGHGAGRPLGLFLASADGIPTSRDSLTGSATDFTYAGINLAKYTLKGPYWARAKWLFHRDGLRRIAALVDGDSRPLWRESVRVGEPDTLLSIPVFMSEYVPNTFTAGLYVGMLGDFSQYWIADSLTMRVQRLVELYAETSQVGFIGRLETDGMPVLAEAFVRLRTD